MEHLPPGSRIAIGDAIIEVSPEPHTGCKQFRERYGLDAVRFVGSPVGKALQLRGINAWVERAGAIRRGDAVCVLFD
jgi:MOSC domain-containing protein YiiM